MVQCNIDIESSDENLDRNSISSDECKKENQPSNGGFHLNPIQPSKINNIGLLQQTERESDTGSMLSKYKIDLIFTINKKDVKEISGKLREHSDILIENKIQERIDAMFKDIALNDMIKQFHVDYLGSIQLNNEKVQSLETLQEPLKKLYISYKKDKQMRAPNKKSILEITNNGLKLSYGNKLEQLNLFSTISVWASVKLITRPHGMNKEFGLEYCFVPLITDYKNPNIKFIKLAQNESYLFPKNTFQDNIPLFIVVMKKMCATQILEMHAFICNSNEDAINIAANLYKTLLVTSNKPYNKQIRQRNGITSCTSIGESVNGSISERSLKGQTQSARKFSIQNIEQTNKENVERRKISSEVTGSRKQSVNENQNILITKADVHSIRSDMEYPSFTNNVLSISNVKLHSKSNQDHKIEKNTGKHSSGESLKNENTTADETTNTQNSKVSSNLNDKWNSGESVRHYVDYVSDAVRKRRNSHMSVESHSRRQRSSSVESVKDFNMKKSNIINKFPEKYKINRYNSEESINCSRVAEFQYQDRDRVKLDFNNQESHRKFSRSSMKEEILQNKCRLVGANLTENILRGSVFPRGADELCPQLPSPKRHRKHSNSSTNSINKKSIDFLRNLHNDVHQRAVPTDSRKESGNVKQIIDMIQGSRKNSSNSSFSQYEIDGRGLPDEKMRKTSLKTDKNPVKCQPQRSTGAHAVSCKSSMNSRRNSISEFAVDDLLNSKLPINLSLQRKREINNHHNNDKQRKDSFTNDTLFIKSNRHSSHKDMSQIDFDAIEVYNSEKGKTSNNKSNSRDIKRTLSKTSGDILTKVAIPRSTSFLKTDSSSKNSLNYTMKSYGDNHDARKLSASKLGLNEIFLELKNQEGLNSLDEILNEIINTDGMSYNELKPIYKEFIVKLALILTKDEFYQKCKVIMSKQKKRKKKIKRTMVINKIIHSKLNKRVNQLFSRSKKKFLRKTSSVCKTKIIKHKIKRRKRKEKQYKLMKDDSGLLANDMNTSSGYFTYSECTYDTDSCTCISADKCYCNSSRGISMSPLNTIPGRLDEKYRNMCSKRRNSDVSFGQINITKTRMPHHQYYNTFDAGTGCRIRNYKNFSNSFDPCDIKARFLSRQYRQHLGMHEVNLGPSDRRRHTRLERRRYDELLDEGIDAGDHEVYENRHCYHCFKFKTCPESKNSPSATCDCDMDSCNESDKCYCDIYDANIAAQHRGHIVHKHNMNMIDMLKMQGFAASDTSIDENSYNEDFYLSNKSSHWKKQTKHQHKSKKKPYIQASKSLEFVQFHNNRNKHGESKDHVFDIGQLEQDSADEPSSSSFSFKNNMEDSPESSMLDYNLFKKSKQQQANQRVEHYKQQKQSSSNKFLVVSARDTKGRIIYVGASGNKKTNQKGHTGSNEDVINNNNADNLISIKKSAEIVASLFSSSSPKRKQSILESSLGYLP